MRQISFVGLNSYEMGSAYTDQIAGMLNEKGTTQILFLSTSSSKTQETNLVYYQVKKNWNPGKKQTSLSICQSTVWIAVQILTRKNLSGICL